MEKMITDLKNKSTKQTKVIKTEDNITVTLYGEPDFNGWAKKMIDVYEKIEFTNQG